MKKMINILLGTKGQLIKMAPLIKEMDNREMEYNLINANQHTKILDEISDLRGKYTSNSWRCSTSFTWTYSRKTKQT